uniref:F-box domain-containing protein n=1 Tax=Caenorhabditis tropicalis TaxID=1561998 RepID=A0A1I7UT66_9PELO
MSLPLLRLPDLVLGEIIKNLSHKEILFLAQTSLRARRRISRHKPLHDIKITFDDGGFDSYVQIFSDNQEIFRIIIATCEEEQFDSSWRFKTIVPVRYEKETLVFLWKGDAFQEILDFLMEIFRIKKVSFEIQAASTCRILHLLEYCVSKNLNIGSVEWPTFSDSVEMTERLLMASRGARNLSFKGFNFPSFNFHQFRMNRLQILEATQMTPDHVVALRNCKNINLEYVEFDEDAINYILLEYMKNPGRLRELRMYCCNDFRIRKVVTGLNIVEVYEGNSVREPKFWFTSLNGIRFSVTKEWYAETVVLQREIRFQ